MTAQAPGDTLQAVLDTVFAAPKYQWVPRMHPARWLWEHFLQLVDWFDRLQTTAPWAYWGIVLGAVIALVAILVHAGSLVARTLRAASVPDAREDGPRAERRDADWYRARARRLADAGRYPEAMRADFEAVILDLSAAGAVRWHPSKTPREYAREARLDPGTRGRIAELVDGVYAASFAGARFGAAEYDAWRAAAGGVSREG